MNEVDTSFIIFSSILVLFMTPGLAFFYGGLVSKKNVVNTMVSVFFITGLAILLWLICGYSLAFSGNIWGIIGNGHHFFFQNLNFEKTTTGGIPVGLYSLFQMMFAIITPALFIGAVVGRINFKFLFFFIIFWSIFIYYPMVHMVWSPNGLLSKLGALDFAGGTVVHINAGITALILAIFVGPRTKKEPQHYNLAWVLLGTAILWIGWYGFNAGSALAVNSSSVLAILTTTMAAASAMATWSILELIHNKKVTLVGTCTGVICGLVAVTPAAGYVSSMGAFWIGIIATGLFASKSANPNLTLNGLFYGGGLRLFLIQLLVTIITIIFVGLMATTIALLLRKFVAIRVTKEQEASGLDLSQHGEIIEQN
ncbi:ammonium transporter [Lactobacillus mulieris]|uniref:ammonium transporter n=1 Tax=Lactobacillus mulieris TaxID=2508708 RepID=UPI0022AC16AF|nr:ammonium transporter [Lactobacillus mulieris]MCZ3689716.1 ammonium transporter [Lactobacillus mulieris]MCZ3695719.1 ammonium transporter [Lactobacillus mulieris]MCZ3701746.1 ammonium transporter [Lactobacillus mulieris]MCZ3703226.1 ammonium transporter [Lactobacillus mulieris]MCZ3704849.1 ammonium transporter [Lactobacillus mulieris]